MLEEASLQGVVEGAVTDILKGFLDDRVQKEKPHDKVRQNSR